MRNQNTSRSAAEVSGVRAMRLMIVLSLLINVAVLVPVCAGLLPNAA
jgi:hypothetical protein